MASGHLNKCKVCYRYYMRKYRLENLSKVKAYDRARGARGYKSKDPVKRAAWAAVTRAIRSGKLVRQPCADCGALVVEAHHNDYTRKLDVEWLCFACHRGTRHGHLVGGI
jgi:hypothetical protein